MLSFLRRWRTRDLVLSWFVYWAVLIVVKLSPAVAAIWRATHAGPEQGSVSFSSDGGSFRLAVSVAGSTTWSGSIHFLALALWLAGPPLLIWLLWAAQRPARHDAATRVSV